MNTILPQSSYHLHDLTYQRFCKTHVSHGNYALSSIAETNTGAYMLSHPSTYMRGSRPIERSNIQSSFLHLLHFCPFSLISCYSLHLSARSNGILGGLADARTTSDVYLSDRSSWEVFSSFPAKDELQTSLIEHLIDLASFGFSCCV
jgi:hypothetical protein